MRSYSEQGTAKVLEDGTTFTVDYRSAEHGGREYYMGLDSDGGWIFAYVDDTTDAAQPKKIAFESVTCGRCKGAGRRNDNGWGANHQGICYRCNGTGKALTANGYRAQQAYMKLRDARLGTTYGDIENGESYWYDGQAYEKGGAEPVLREATKVRRHDGAATRKMWAEVAKRYKGATLVY